ncbi:MAG TPA: PQQ-binding-like beta-propeller repeat protein [Bacteroidales bacterium]|nr:PQQ-binding-like beta-propeller repeat protein [Bacteroidales bacterium]
MKRNITEKERSVIDNISKVAAGFTLLVALTMIFSFLQLKVINPLDSPVLLSLKEQYDRDPLNTQLAEQIRAMDLMARKAYFSSRWQVETGSYLLLAGAVIFFICRRIIAGNEKLNPVLDPVKDQTSENMKGRKYLFASAALVFVAALTVSLLMRGSLPETSQKKAVTVSNDKNIKLSEPDKTNYPFFRGQDGRGIVGGSSYPTQWDGAQMKNIAWKTAIPMQGQSSPVIWENKIFLTGTDGKNCEVYCIDKKDGSIVWTTPVTGTVGTSEEIQATDNDNGLASSTVAANKNYVCAVFGNGNLACLDHNGKTIWSMSLGVPENAYGYASSLIIYEDLLLVQFDSDSKISLLGIEMETGETKWETMRTGRPVWSSPVLAYFGGVPQVIINGNPNVTSFDAVTGKELWSIECLSGDVAPSLAVNSSMVYSVTDYAKLAAIKGGPGASIVWEDNMFTPDVSSPVANEQYLFISTGIGDVACYNAQKGDTLWTHYFMDQFYASPVIADEKVYLLDRNGVMHIVSAGPEYSLIAESPLGERTDCTPAFSDKKIFIRGKENLYCISED